MVAIAMPTLGHAFERALIWPSLLALLGASCPSRRVGETTCANKLFQATLLWTVVLILTAMFPDELDAERAKLLQYHEQMLGERAKRPAAPARSHPKLP